MEHSLALGTAIHGTPLISALRAVLPDARIVAAASGFGLGILQGNPHLTELVNCPSPLQDLPNAVRTLRHAPLFKGDPFAVVQTTGNGRSRIILACMLSGAHVRAGHTTHPELSSAPVRFDTSKSQIANNLEIVNALGHGEALAAVLRDHPRLSEPVVFPSLSDAQRVRELIHGEGVSDDAPLAVFITQTSVTQRKQWRAERFRRVAEMLSEEYGCQIVFGGTAAEAPAIEALCKGIKARTSSVAGRTSLLELAALFGMADIALTLDTGPLHLARAMQVPTVIVAPAWSPIVEWLPVGNPKVRILKNRDMPYATDDYVIDEVSAEEVEEALRELLRTYPPGSSLSRMVF